MPALQLAVAHFVADNRLDAPVAARLLDLVSEIGELAKEALKGTNYGQVEFAPPPAWAEELGDCFFALVCLANSTDVDLEAALEHALEKYRDRLGRSGEAGSGR